MRSCMYFIAASLICSAASPDAHGQEMPSGPNEKVLGIGGLFFRAKDPKALARWYYDNLGIRLTPQSYDEEPWMQTAGPTVFAPFSMSTGYFGDSTRVWMVNFRVRDLDAITKQLRENGTTVTVDPETYPNGRFARCYDPEGNPIELWEMAERREK